MNQPTVASVKKRIFMFYFAAGLNLMMGLYVISAGGGVVAGGMLTVITLVFLGFAALNFFVARSLSKRLEEQLRQLRMNQAEQATGEEARK